MPVTPTSAPAGTAPSAAWRIGSVGSCESNDCGNG